MSNVVLFTHRPERTVEQNLQEFIRIAKNELTVFGKDLDFSQNSWDITDAIGLTGKRNKKINCIFNDFTSRNTKSPSSMQEPFLSFAKAYMRYMHGFKPTKSFGSRLTALRVLDDALQKVGKKNITAVDGHVLNIATQQLVNEYKEDAAYRVGSQLEMLAMFLVSKGMLSSTLNWKNPMKRPPDTERVGPEADKRREEKLVSQAALDALPKIFRMAIEPRDKLISATSALMLSAPDRISEVVTLPLDCEVTKNIDGKEFYGLRWRPAKGGKPMVKWVIPSMVDVVKEALRRIIDITQPARNLASWYEENSKKLFLTNELEYLRHREVLSGSEVCQIFGFSQASKSNLRAMGLQPISRESKQECLRYRFTEIEKYVIDRLPVGFPFLDKKLNLKYSDALFVMRLNEMHGTRATYHCLFEAIDINIVGNHLGARVKHKASSIFDVFGFHEPNGDPIEVTSHQFRHYLNTLAHAGGLSELEIAKWSGRMDVRQNKAYDHVSSNEMLQLMRTAIGEPTLMSGPLARLKNKSLITRDKFEQIIIPTAHVTDFGYCIHDYAMSPCEINRDCLNCQEMVCIKGDQIAMESIRKALAESTRLIELAESAVNEGSFGANRWLEHHSNKHQRLSELKGILDDPSIPLGTVIQLSSPKTQIEREPLKIRSKINDEKEAN